MKIKLCLKNISIIFYCNNFKGFFFFFFFFSFILYAQNNISGQLTTIENESIEGANILLKTVPNEVTVGYGISDSEGNFTLKAKSDKYKLKISYLGFKTITKEVILNAENISLGIIKMTENSSELEEVILKAESNIIKRGDTTIFKTDKFLNGTEQNLIDILKTIPGLDINDQGKVTANGKEVDRLLIDGENLFKKQHQFATENIPSNMVGNLELIKNYSDFESIQNSEKTGVTALNVTVKEDFKNKLTGTSTIGGGIENKYEIKSALYNFNKKIKTSFIANFNNLGTVPITIRDYFDLTDPPPINPENLNSGVIFSNIDELPSFLSSGDKVKNKSTNFGTLSLIYNLDDNLKIDFYGVLNQSKQENLFSSNKLLNSSTNAISITEKHLNQETNLFGVGHLKSIYKQNKNSIFVFNSNFEIDFSEKEATTENTIDNNVDTFLQDSKPRKIISSSTFSYTGKVEDAIFKTGIYLNYNDFEIRNDIEANRPFLNLSFDDNKFLVSQFVKKETLATGVDLNYNLTKRKFSFSIYSNLSYNNEKLHSKINNQLLLNNNLELTTTKSTIGTNFTYNINKYLSYKVGVDYNYLLKYFNNNSAEITYLGLNTNLKTVLNNNNIGQLSYNFSNEIPRLDNLIEQGIIKDYRNIIFNDDVTFESLFPFHKFNYNHFIFLPKNKMSFIFNASHKFNEKAINNKVISDTNLTTSKDKIVAKDNNSSLLIFFEKQLSRIPITISNSITYDFRSKNYLENDVTREFKTNKLDGKMELKSNLKKSPVHFNIGYQFSLENFSLNQVVSKLIIQEPFVSLKGSITESLIWKWNTSYKSYKSGQNNRNILYVNPELSLISEKSKIEYSLIGTNILNLNNRNIIENHTLPGVLEQRINSILEGNIIFSAKLRF